MTKLPNKSHMQKQLDYTANEMNVSSFTDQKPKNKRAKDKPNEK
ncbi:hypothetical protein NZD89_08690 [Alicyclobacillus fastidiosus]|uniref:Small acid-soluble spore protein O n=1 Tax=Alicyclobacillus fastidiosus TaxID=392011 RepID=A0ABY6ZLI4_9BACL|nr:hypothetical protein [Alicyclobacillus fastidiosus]WAH43443.1 hypothetical protein NZD89_08690 [Alicyclobacillus fastidiosus]GMA59596.1 hypothetical protein GCM10025859_00360 [Alicyclobacillus fastidiosus]GMA65524.1 hypothetical protein GCM10025859_59640 [Alicyclobacillus fastidiosus]